MAVIFKHFRTRFFNLFPLILLFYFCLSEFNAHFRFFGIVGFDFQFILIYYWVLKKPQTLGYGFIFVAGIINDVILGLPLGLSSASYLIISSFAAYIRNVSVTKTLSSNWIAFGPTLVITNLIYVGMVIFIADLDVEYMQIFYNSIFTFLFFPIGWIIFEIFINLTREDTHL